MYHSIGDLHFISFIDTLLPKPHVRTPIYYSPSLLCKMDLLFSLTKHKGAPPLAAAAPRDVQCPGRVTQPQLLGAFNIY